MGKNMKNEIIDTNYIDIKEVCKLLKIEKSTAYELVKSCNDVKIIKKGITPTKLYNKQEILNIQLSKQQQQMETLDNQSSNLANNKNIEVIANAFMKSIDNIDLNDKENFDKLMVSQMYMLQKTINKLNERIENKDKEKEILQNWKEEKLKLENNEYKKKELRANINKLIRKIAKDNFNNNFKETWNYFYKKYCDIHCFQGKQDIELIEKRGDLQEFYNLILNY